MSASFFRRPEPCPALFYDLISFYGKEVACQNMAQSQIPVAQYQGQYFHARLALNPQYSPGELTY